MPAPLILAFAGASGFTALAGAGIASAIGLGTVGTAAATAIGTAAIAGGLTAVQGGSVSNVLKSAVIGGVTSYIGAEVSQSVSTDVFFQAIANDVSGSTALAMGNVVGAAAAGAAAAGFQAAATGRDAISALLRGGLTAGLTAGVGETVNGLMKEAGIGPGVLSSTFGRALSSAVATNILGGSGSTAFTASLLSSAVGAVGGYLSNQLVDKSDDVKLAADTLSKIEESMGQNIASQKSIIARDTTEQNAIKDRIAAYQSRVDAYNRDYAAYDYDGRFSAPLTREAESIKTAIDTYNNTTRPALEAQINKLVSSYEGLTNDFQNAQTDVYESVAAYQAQELANSSKVITTLNAAQEVQTLYKEAKGTDIPRDLLDDYLPSLDPAANVANDPTTIDRLVQEINVHKVAPDFNEQIYKNVAGLGYDANPYLHYLEIGKNLDLPTNATENAEYEKLKSIARKEGYTLQPEDIKLYRDLSDPTKVKEITQRFDDAKLNFTELSAIAREEGVTLSAQEASELLKSQSGSESEAGQRLRQLLDPRAINLTEAKEALIAAGASPQFAESQAWNAAGAGEGRVQDVIDQYSLKADDVLAIAAKEGAVLTREQAQEIADKAGVNYKFQLEQDITPNLDARGLTYAEAKNAAAAEGYNLTEDEFKQFAGKAGTEADLIKQVQGYADPKYTTQAEAEEALIAAGFTPEFAKQQAYFAQGSGEGQVDSIVNRYTLDADEVLAIAAKEGVTLTRDEAASIAKQAGAGYQLELERNITSDLDARGLTRAEAINAAAAEGYALTDKDLEQFLGKSGSEADLLAQVRSYADEKFTTQEEAKQLLMDAGLSEKQAEDEAWFVSGLGDRTAVVEQTANKYAEAEKTGIDVPVLSEDAQEAAKKLVDVQAVAAEEGVKLTENQLDQYLKSDADISTIQQQIDASKLTTDELSDIAAAQGYTLTQADIDRYNAISDPSVAEARARDEFDLAVMTPDEIKEYAKVLVPEGFDLSPTEIAALGSGDERTVKTRLENYIDQNYVDRDELQAEAKKYGYTLSDADIAEYVGRGTESAVLGQAGADFDRQTVDRAELEARAKAEGYTLTDADIARFTGQKDETSTLDEAQGYFDSHYITRPELQEIAAKEGYTLTSADYSAYSGKVDDESSTLNKAYSKFSDPNIVDLDELQALATQEGYTLTPEDIAAYTGRRNEVETLKGVQGMFAAKGITDTELAKLRWDYGDPEMTREEAQNLSSQYADWLTKLPDADAVDYGEAKAMADSLKLSTGYVFSDAEIRSFMGMAPESGLKQRMADYIDPRYIDITEARNAANAEGWYPTDAQLQSMGYVGKKDEATYLPQYIADFDQRALSIPEVKDAAASYGYTITDTDATNLKKALEYSTPDKTTIGYVENTYLPEVLDAQTVDANEIRAAFKAYGYTPTDDEVAAIQKNFPPTPISSIISTANKSGGAYNLINNSPEYYATGIDSNGNLRYTDNSAWGKPQGVWGYIDSTEIDKNEVKQWALNEGYDAATAAAIAASFQPIKQPGVNVEGTIGAQIQQEFDRNAVNNSEAYDELIKAGVPISQILSGETAKFTGVGDEATKLKSLRDYVDTVIVTPAEVRQQLIAQGVPASEITDAMVAPFVRSDYITPTTYSDVYGNTITRFSPPTPKQDSIFSSISTQYDPLYTSSDEAEQAFKAAGYTPTPEEIAQFTGGGGEDTRLNQLKSYVDANTLDLTELEELAGKENYTITPEDIAKYVGQGKESDLAARAAKYFDDSSVSIDEARAAFAQLGYEPSDKELSQFVGRADEAGLAKRVGDFVDPLMVDADELRAEAQKYGYTLTPEDIARYSGVGSETDVLKRVGEIFQGVGQPKTVEDVTGTVLKDTPIAAQTYTAPTTLADVTQSIFKPEGTSQPPATGTELGGIVGEEIIDPTTGQLVIPTTTTTTAPTAKLPSDTFDIDVGDLSGLLTGTSTPGALSGASFEDLATLVAPPPPPPLATTTGGRPWRPWRSA